MGVIRVLDEQLANQIAAGEVVERPASVVKELVENALDAGAARIEVEIEGGGADRIRVADDGAGMARDDARLAFARHATSKIRGAEDLRAIVSFGFRGEALPSIASVSRVRLTTSTGQGAGGTRVIVKPGAVVVVEPAPHPRGTTVEVEALFANAPARRKFLRAPATEAAHVADLLARVAAAHPAVAFVLRSGGRESAVWPAVPSYRERVAQIVGADDAAALVPVEKRAGPDRVLGLASTPQLHRSTTRHVLFFANARPIRDRRLLHAVQEAYSTLLPRGRSPLAYLFIEVPADDVDVNVHPAKLEVRFRRPQAAHDLVREALREAHGVARPFYRVSAAGIGVAEPSPATGRPAAPAPGPTAEAPGPTRWGPSAEATAGPPRSPAGVTAAASDLFAASDIEPLAQYRDTYIIAQTAEGLVIVDQHAAHERVLYESHLDAARRGRVGRQRLLFPATIDITPAQGQVFERVAPAFHALGFALEPFGPDALKVDEAPGFVPAPAVTPLVKGMLDEALEWDRTEGDERLRSRMAATTACHAAVRAHQPLASGQMRQILADLMRSRQPMTCPHGRPTLIRLPLDRLEREFQRR